MRSRRRIPCNVPWSWLHVDALGNARPCCFATRYVGNLVEQPLDAVWNGPHMQRMRGALRDGYVDRFCRDSGCAPVQAALAEHGVDALDFRCDLDVVVEVGAASPSNHCVDGWMHAEYWGVRTRVPSARLIVDLTASLRGDAKMLFLCRRAGEETGRLLDVSLEVNGEQGAEWSVGRTCTWQVLTIPASLVRDQRIDVRFSLPLQVDDITGRPAFELLSFLVSELPQTSDTAN